VDRGRTVDEATEQFRRHQLLGQTRSSRMVEQGAVRVDARLLAGLPETERLAVLQAGRRRRFRRGEVVFHEGDLGDSLHMILRGHVAIRVSTPLGDTATLTVLGPPESFGEGALLSDDARRTATVVALDQLETLSLVRGTFERLRAAHPSVENVLVAVLALQVRRLSQHLLEALFVPADTRVLRRLLEMADAFWDEPREAASGRVVLPLTQEDVASAAGTTRSTANRVLHAVAADGLVGLSRGRIEIVDRDGLASRAR
jgi:CRP/FNR family transcriptional regulator, cyclic AMP receptor protein